MKRALVTGGAGFIGGHIARKLLNQGYDVSVIDNLRTGSLHNLRKNINFFHRDLGVDDIDDVFVNEFDLVYHFSGQSSVETSYLDPVYDLDSNTRSTLRILSACEKFAPNAHILYASTMSVYGYEGDMPKSEDMALNGENFYAIGKRASELYIDLFSKRFLNTTVLRLFNIYGPGQNLQNMAQGMVSIYLSQAIFSDSILVKGSLDRTRDFLYISDLLQVLDILENNSSCFGKTINICSGVESR